MVQLSSVGRVHSDLVTSVRARAGSDAFGNIRLCSATLGGFGRARLCPAALRQFGFSGDEKPLSRVRPGSRLVTSRGGLGFQTLTRLAGGAGARGAAGGRHRDPRSEGRPGSGHPLPARLSQGPGDAHPWIARAAVAGGANRARGCHPMSRRSGWKAGHRRGSFCFVFFCSNLSWEWRGQAVVP